MNEDLERKKQKRAEEDREQFAKRQKHLANKSGLDCWGGLYHGNRRVRAKIGDGKGFASTDGWLLAPDEKDLIAALGTDWFPEKVNRADLKKRFGLEIKKELAPTIALEGYPYWKRTDEWGSEATPYQDDRPLIKKVGISSFSSFLGLLFFSHVVLASIPFSRLTSAWQKAIAIPLFLGILALSDEFREFHGLSGWAEFLLTIGWLYACLPVIAGLLHVIIYEDKLPKPR